MFLDRKCLSAIPALILTLLIVACGGGGGGSEAPADDPPTDQPAPAPDPGPSPNPTPPNPIPTPDPVPVDLYESRQADPNTIYIARSDQEVVLTLPTELDVDAVVTIRGAGAGGWRIAQNEGQEMKAQSLGVKVGDTWTLRGAARAGSWRGVASSTDGKRLVVVAFDDIYTSTDSGLTWTRRNTGIEDWFYVASSADGTKLVAAQRPGLIYVSVNSGETWAPAPNSPSAYWRAVASSEDGSKLVAAELGGPVYTSVNGEAWKPAGPSASWWSVASSADGTRLAAAGESGIYVSTTSAINSDENWTRDDPPLVDPSLSIEWNERDSCRPTAAGWGRSHTSPWSTPGLKPLVGRGTSPAEIGCRWPHRTMARRSWRWSMGVHPHLHRRRRELDGQRT